MHTCIGKQLSVVVHATSGMSSSLGVLQSARKVDRLKYQIKVSGVRVWRSIAAMLGIKLALDLGIAEPIHPVVLSCSHAENELAGSHVCSIKPACNMIVPSPDTSFLPCPPLFCDAANLPAV